MRRKSIDTLIAEAARDIKRTLIKRAGGCLPRSVRGWQRLVRESYAQWWPDFECDPAFRGALDRDVDRGYWVITYNPYIADRDICRAICHELFELYAHFDYGSLFDLDDEFHGAYHGQVDPVDLRHRIALRGERLCFRSRPTMNG